MKALTNPESTVNKNTKQLEQLRSLIEIQMFVGPVFDSLKWAAKPIAFYADKIGVKERTIRRWIKADPDIHDKQRVHQGRKVLLLRVGKASPQSKTDIAKDMCRRYRRRVGKDRTTRYEFCCTLTLIDCWTAHGWPMGEAPNILSYTLRNWGEFMGVYDIEAEYIRKLDHPNIRVICRFRTVASDLYEMHLQWNKTAANVV